MTIKFTNVCFTYPGAATPILQDLNLEILQPAFVAIIGSNGSGKTTLAKTLTGIIPQFIQGTLTGAISIGAVNVTTSSVATLATQIGYVYQDFEHQLVKPRVIDDVGFSALNYGFADYHQRAQHALQRLELTHLAQRYIWELSGGEQHLVALAGTLALEPDIIVIDEPIAQLDPINARIVYEKLAALHRNDQKTILVIEHHSEFIAEYCTHVAYVKHGSILWYLPVDQGLLRSDDLVQAHISPPITTQIVMQLITAGVIAPNSIPTTIQQGIQLLKPLVTTPPHLSHTTPPIAHDAHPIITLTTVSKNGSLLDGTEIPIIKQLCLCLYTGQRVAVVGQNGAGKSTLLRLIAEIDHPDSGSITHTFTDTSRKTQPIAYIHQRPQELFVTDTVFNDLVLYATTHGYSLDYIDDLIQQFELSELLHRDPRLLSGGQMRRVALAIGMSMQPRVLLIDEPTANLDALNRSIILRLLHNLHSQTQTVLIATHDMDLVLHWATRVIVMHDGEMLADVHPTQLFADSQLVLRARISMPPVVSLGNALGLCPPPLSTAHLLTYLQQPNT
jgi:energy-coupling factor transport system ATP-binding protein